MRALRGLRAARWRAAACSGACRIDPWPCWARVAVRAGPEIEKVEPIGGIAAAVSLEQARVARDRRFDRPCALRPGDVREVRQRLENDVVTVPAAVEPQHEQHTAPEQGGSAHRPKRQVRRGAEEADRQRGFIAERAVGQYPDQRATIQALANLEHRIDVAERDDLGWIARLGGGPPRV